MLTTEGRTARTPARTGWRSRALPAEARSLVLAASAGLALLTPAGAQEARPTATKADASAPATGSSDYVIGAGDVLQVFVWKEPELTREAAVRVDGRITVPLIGDLQAAGRTPQQLGKELGRELGRFLEAPQVTVGVSQPNSSRFYVVGNVARAGQFPLASRLTVLQALAIAGGFGEYAKTDSIVVIRDDDGNQTVIPVNYKKLESGREIASQNVALMPGDVIVVP
jgi:polysaccharide export outer membrane protein